MTIVESRVNVWEALAGRPPGTPLGPADGDLWSAVAERLNPARARPVLRENIEIAELISIRDVPYMMLRSPDERTPCYLRLTPHELQLAQLMDGTRTVARLVADFARVSGRLAPDQVTRVVADLAGNRMLEELPVDAFHPLRQVRSGPLPLRLGRGLLAAARGRRMVVADIDPLITLLYRAGGRWLFTWVAAVAAALVAAAGLGAFCWQWARGATSVFLVADSYVLGALALLGLNVLALASHELGHALAAKHAGRSVPGAGFLVYFGIPSVFVDTSDVWMADRRARLITTATGPATGLVLAGGVQLLGLAVPPLAPLAFKLTFAWYLNALFNLNPFLAMDGYYLLMDWLEIPNLRARGIAWVAARARRRPLPFGQLDSEGRLIAVYGMLAMAWIAIAVNLGYRIWIDRVAGLVTGLWHTGAGGRLLLVALVAALAAPLVHVAAGAALRGVRRAVRWWRAREETADLPDRVMALAGSSLGSLPLETLTDLASRARWRHPATGTQVVFAGAAMPDVLVVVDGALEARRPGDPSGTIRERVGAGGLVGLANALTGAPAAMAWHTAGTRLLAVPASAVVTAVGPLPGAAPVDLAELETLLAEAQALAGRSAEDRLGLAAQARPVDLAPGERLELVSPNHALIVASGAVDLAGGGQARRGAIIGPVPEPVGQSVGVARSPARLWSLSGVVDLPLGNAGGGDHPGLAPASGVHPAGTYPPLASPPGPPPAQPDTETDRWFERRLWWLLLLLLLLALGLTATNLVPGPVFAEMPTDRALLIGVRGTTTAVVDGVTRRLGPGDRLYLSASDTVTTHQRGGARLTFRGGGTAVICAGSSLTLGPLVNAGRAPIAPSTDMELRRGRLLLDTRSESAAFAPLAVSLNTSAQDRIASTGSARFAAGEDDALVAQGAVTRNGIPVQISGGRPVCGDGTSLPERRTVPSPADSPSVSASLPGSASPSPGDSPSTVAPAPVPDPARTTRPPATPPTTPAPPPTTSSPVPEPSPSPSPSDPKDPSPSADSPRPSRSSRPPIP